MPYKINYDKENDCILVSVHGELDIRLIQHMATDISKMVKEMGCKRILNDLRDANPSRTIEIYNMPKTAKKAGIAEACKRALVAGDKVSDFTFLETVFKNRGHQVNLFENLDDAMDWLLND